MKCQESTLKPCVIHVGDINIMIKKFKKTEILLPYVRVHVSIHKFDENINGRSIETV